MNSNNKPSGNQPTNPSAVEAWKVTAFALGELKGQEEIEMKNRVEKDPELQKSVSEIQRTAHLVTDELSKEEIPRLAVPEREKILRATEKKSWIELLRNWRVSAPAMGALVTIIFACMILTPEHFRINRPESSRNQAPPAAVSPSGVNPPAADPSLVVKSPIAPADPPASAPSGQIVDDAEEAPYQFEGDAIGDAIGEAPSANLQEAPAGKIEATISPQDKSPSIAAPAPGKASELRPNASKAKKFGSVRQGGAVKLSEKTSVSDESQKDLAKTGLLSAFGGGVRENLVGRFYMGHRPVPVESSTARYSHFADNDFKKVSDDALSTFSTDVDTASYANVRRFLVSSQLPPADAVRTEELINYFTYDYAPPKDGKPFAVHTEVATAPWKAQHQILRVGLKGRMSSAAARPDSNLVFLLDVSGSMMPAERLPLAQRALKLLVNQMRPQDRVSIVVYAGNSGVALESTRGTEKQKILAAIDGLTAGGSTNGAGGIEKAYEIAAKNFVKGGINRVILATDGDFNVGTTSESELVRLIEQKAKTGVFLTTLGFGADNLNDSMMVKLAGKGNGNYHYIDSFREAKKVLLKQMGSTINAIAKDVKIQVEFNPRYVSSYRLIGYEKRMLQHQDFNDDTKDAGEIGEGHTVTALYEIVPVGVSAAGPGVDPLKYQKNEKPLGGVENNEMAHVKLRYKEPEGSKSSLIEVPVKNQAKIFDASSADMQFAASVAGFAMILRSSQHKGDFNFEQVQGIASRNASFRGEPDEYRKEFVELIKKARSLTNSNGK